MGYTKMFVCDNCGRPPDGDSPDFIYSHENHHNPCDTHDLCNECIARQSRRNNDGRSKAACPVCERIGAGTDAQ